tara:strand:+ start:563 stop:745 length:183 start_codon:yes stop_codon:yes gene_type:complete
MKNESPLDELLGQITKWKIEADSPHNDGWTREHYEKMLDEVSRVLKKALPQIGEELDNYD